MPKLIILDLDETLIRATKTPLEKPHDFIVGEYFVYQRPFLAQFLAFCFSHADVAVWTSSGETYADSVVQHIFTNEQRQRLAFVWSRQKCVQRFDPYRFQDVFIKDLKKVKKRFPLENVIMIDDTPQKLARNYGNLVRVREFLGNDNDDELRKLCDYLPNLLTVENVRTVEKRHWRYG